MITRKGQSGTKTIMREKLAIGDPEKKSTEQTWVVKGCKNYRPTLKKILQIGPLGLNQGKVLILIDTLAFEKEYTHINIHKDIHI